MGTYLGDLPVRYATGSYVQFDKASSRYFEGVNTVGKITKVKR